MSTQNESNELALSMDQIAGEIIPIETDNSYKLTEKEMKLAVLIAGREVNKLGLDECYKLAGFSRAGGYKARQKKHFQDYVEELLDHYNKEQVATVYGRLHDIIKSSKNERNVLEAMKIWLSMTGKMKQEVTHKHETEHVYSIDVAKFEMELLDKGLSREDVKRLGDKAQKVGVDKVRQEVDILTLDIDDIK